LLLERALAVIRCALMRRWSTWVGNGSSGFPRGIEWAHMYHATPKAPIPEKVEAPTVNSIERVVRLVDEKQQRSGPLGFTFAVVKKFGDDRGGMLAALLTFYGFLSLFPLLLLLVTILGFFPGGAHSLVHRVERSAFSEFPIVGTKLSSNIHELHRKSIAGLIVGIAGVIWGSQGAMQTAQFAQAQVWNLPGDARPNFWSRGARTLTMMGALGLFLLASTVAAGFVTIGNHTLSVAILGSLASLVLNVGLFVVAFRILTPAQVGWSSMITGAVAGGVAWTALQYLGGILVDHTLRNASPVYGFFAVVLGLIGWIYFGSEVIVYAAEVNVVKARRLWPRAMVQPPLTKADKQVLSAIVLQDKRRPEQTVEVGYDPEVGSADPGATTESAGKAR
jgi:YihY family inner membrane protein